jgi:hypothetical protein
MGYNRKPNYHFKTKNDTGIDKVPNGRIIVVEDYDGSVKTFSKVSNNGLNSTTTIENFANSHSSLGITDENELDNQIKQVTNEVSSSAIAMALIFG